jgi:hypothetical protein
MEEMMVLWSARDVISAADYLENNGWQVPVLSDMTNYETVQLMGLAIALGWE